MNYADARILVSYQHGKIVEKTVELTCAITTLCPCSKEISEYSAHNQRGYIKMSAWLTDNYDESFDWKAVLLNAAQSNASAAIHPILNLSLIRVKDDRSFERIAPPRKNNVICPSFPRRHPSITTTMIPSLVRFFYYFGFSLETLYRYLSENSNVGTSFLIK